jgi:hypothetical protein
MKRKDVETTVEYLPRPRPGCRHRGSAKPAKLRVFYPGTDNLKTVKTILGYTRRPKYRKRKKKSAEWEVAVERPTYDLTIFKLHCGKLTLKI